MEISLLAKKIKNNFLDLLTPFKTPLSEDPLHRAKEGGHWEYWYLGDGPSCFQAWIKVPKCTRNHPEFRPLCCHGTPICEDHKENV